MTDATDDAGFLPDVSAEAPCGPDLEAEGDAEFMNFMATVEGQLPAAYFRSIERPSICPLRSRAAASCWRAAMTPACWSFWPSSPSSTATSMVSRIGSPSSRACSPIIGTTRILRAEDGDFIARISQLSTLDDGPVVVLPLQYAPLAETQRDGVLTFRAQMAAIGEANLREGETLPNSATIDRILLNAEMARLAQTLRSLLLLKTSIAQIRTTLIERVGFEQAVNFESLSPLVDKMASFIQAAVALRDPTVAAPAAQTDETAASSDAGPPGPAPEYASLADIDAALGAALAYFEAMEPSSAAVLLIGQARRLLGKNLYEVMKILTPAQADAARIFVGADAAFMVPVSSILAGSDPVDLAGKT